MRREVRRYDSTRYVRSFCSSQGHGRLRDVGHGTVVSVLVQFLGGNANLVAARVRAGWHHLKGQSSCMIAAT